MDDIKFTKSPKTNKKYRAYYMKNGKLKHSDFGAIGYQQYKDSTGLGLYSHLDHLDKKRRDAYRARHSKIKLKDGRYAYKVKYSPSWLSYNFL